MNSSKCCTHCVSLLLALVESKRRSATRRTITEPGEDGEVHSHHLELLAHGLLVQALLMPGFVLKRSCGGFVEFVPLAMQGRKMLALLAGLAEMSPAARAAGL
jgi:hypothetical protein